MLEKKVVFSLYLLMCVLCGVGSLLTLSVIISTKAGPNRLPPRDIETQLEGVTSGHRPICLAWL